MILSGKNTIISECRQNKNRRKGHGNPRGGNLFMCFSLSFAKRHMHCVAKTLADLLADVLPNANDMAGCPHLNDLPIVGHPVECSVDGQTAFTEHCLNIVRHLHAGGIHIFVLQDDCVKFQEF